MTSEKYFCPRNSIRHDKFFFKDELTQESEIAYRKRYIWKQNETCVVWRNDSILSRNTFSNFKNVTHNHITFC